VFKREKERERKQWCEIKKIQWKQSGTGFLHIYRPYIVQNTSAHSINDITDYNHLLSHNI